MGACDGACRIEADVGQLDLVIAGLGQQTGDQRADLAGAENEYAMHMKFHLKMGGAFCPFRCT